MQYFIKRGEKVQGPFKQEQLINLYQQGKILDADLISQQPEGPFFPAIAAVKNFEKPSSSPDIQITPKSIAPAIPTSSSYAGQKTNPREQNSKKIQSNPPLLSLVDSLIEIKELEVPSEKSKSKNETNYEYSIYAFIICTAITMLFMIISALAVESYQSIWFAIALPVSLTWFVIGIWGIRKTAELVKSNQVIITTDLPIGLTNLSFRILGGILVAASVFLFGYLIYLAIQILGSENDSGPKLAALWQTVTFIAPLLAGSAYLGYLLWLPESTLSHPQLNSITQSDETASVSNEFWSTMIIMTKNLYCKFSMLLLIFVTVALLLILSFCTSPLVAALLIDGAVFKLLLPAASSLTFLFTFYLSFLPLALWMLSVAGVLSVEVSLAILACGRLATKNLRS
ncbi:MAG: hypothetical protein VX438_14080 [Planctomycetota bacterium]|nr:hypothetical protein [Planctomycetota bacterium]